MNNLNKILVLSNYNGFVKIPFDKTMMTIPSILLDLLSVRVGDPKSFVKELACKVKQDIINADYDFSLVRGKFSTKVQEYAWAKVLKFEYKPKLLKFESSITVPYVFNGKKSTMTVPSFVVDIEIARRINDGDDRNYSTIKKEVIKFISSLASETKSKMLETMSDDDIKMTFSQKVHEIVLKNSIISIALNN